MKHRHLVGSYQDRVNGCRSSTLTKTSRAHSRNASIIQEEEGPGTVHRSPWTVGVQHPD